MNTFIGQADGFAKFIHKADCTSHIRGYEDYPEEVGKSGYFTEKDDSETVTVIKLNIPDCYEILGKKAYLRVPDISMSAYLRSKGERFTCKCVPYDDEFWDIVENIPK